MEGVTFGLFAAEATEFTEENAIEVTSTNEAGEFTFEVPYGDYQVAELETVPGYIAQAEPIAVELDKTDVDLEDIANGADGGPHLESGRRDGGGAARRRARTVRPGRIAVGYLGNQRHSPCHPRPACG